MGTGCSSDNSSAALPPELPSLKIALVGDPQVGKTSVMLRYLRNQFSPMYIPTKKVAIENDVRKLNVPANTVVSLTLWDIPGREDMDLHKSYFRNLDAAIVIVDMNNKSTIDMAHVWKQTVVNKVTKTVEVSQEEKVIDKDGNPVIDGKAFKDVPVDPVTFPVLLLGNKYDLIEEQMLEDFARKQVSVSVDFNQDDVHSHESIEQLQQASEQHGFLGSVMVSAKQGDNSVTMAIQSLVRHVLEKLHLPRKWRPVEKPKEEPKPTEVQYDKLQMTGLEKYDQKISKADSLVKQTVILQHYFNVAVARFRDCCVNGDIVEKERTSLEDCIVGLKNNVMKGSRLKVTEDEGFYKLEVVLDNEEVKVKQTKPWKQAYRCFHKEYAAICKAILKEGPTLETALEKCDVAMERMTDDCKLVDNSSTNPKESKKIDMVLVTNQIEHNRAKILHAKQECRKCIERVEKAGRKISNANLW